MENVNIVCDIVSHIIAAASLVTAITPTPSPDTLFGKLYKLIELMALVTDKTKQK